MARGSSRKKDVITTFQRKMHSTDKCGAEKCDNKKLDVVGKKTKHPTVANMVIAALDALSDKRGSSCRAIKHYMASTYQIDPVKMKTFIRRFLKQALADGTLVQTKGHGISGSFRLSKRARESASGEGGPGHNRKGLLRDRIRQRELERSITDQDMLKTMRKIRKPVATAMRAAICDAKVPSQCVKTKFSNTLM